MIVDGPGRAVAFRLAPGQAHELPMAPARLNSLPDAPLWIVGDRGFASHTFRGQVWDGGTRPAIPSKSNEALVSSPAWIYTNRNVVEMVRSQTTHSASSTMAVCF